MQQGEAEKALAEAGRAREELRRGGAAEELAGRLAGLEAAIAAAGSAARWRQAAADELRGAGKCVDLAEVRPLAM